MPLAGLTEDGLVAAVVLFGIEVRLAALDLPAGEGFRGLADISLGVVADAEGEKLHQLAGVVLVGIPFLTAARIEPDEHGRVFGYLLHQCAKVAEGMAAHEVVLPEHKAG